MCDSTDGKRPEQASSTEADSWLLEAAGGDVGGLPVGTGFLFGVMESSGTDRGDAGTTL